MRRLYTAMGACNRCYGNAGSSWLLKKNKDLTLLLSTNMLLKVLLVWFNNALRAHTTKMVCEGPFPNIAFSGGRLNRQNVLSPSSCFPSDWRKLLTFVHKKATLLHDPNREFLTNTGRTQPVNLSMHQIKLSSLLLMKQVTFPRMI